MSTIRLTMAQGLVRYLMNQFTIVDGEEVPLFPGIFGIFGHGNVTCLSEALGSGEGYLSHLARAERTVHGAGCHCLCQGQTPPPNHGRDVFDWTRRYQHGYGSRLWPTQTDCRC